MGRAPAASSGPSYSLRATRCRRGASELAATARPRAIDYETPINTNTVEMSCFVVPAPHALLIPFPTKPHLRRAHPQPVRKRRCMWLRVTIVDTNLVCGGPNPLSRYVITSPAPHNGRHGVAGTSTALHPSKRPRDDLEWRCPSPALSRLRRPSPAVTALAKALSREAILMHGSRQERFGC